MLVTALFEHQRYGRLRLVSVAGGLGGTGPWGGNLFDLDDAHRCEP